MTPHFFCSKEELDAYILKQVYKAAHVEKKRVTENKTIVVLTHSMYVLGYVEKD